VQFFDWIE